MRLIGKKYKEIKSLGNTSSANKEYYLSLPSDSLETLYVCRGAKINRHMFFCLVQKWLEWNKNPLQIQEWHNVEMNTKYRPPISYKPLHVGGLKLADTYFLF